MIPRSPKKRILGMSLWYSIAGTSSSSSGSPANGLLIRLKNKGITRNSSDEVLVHPDVTTYAMKNDACSQTKCCFNYKDVSRIFHSKHGIECDLDIYIFLYFIFRLSCLDKYPFKRKYSPVLGQQQLALK